MKPLFLVFLLLCATGARAELPKTLDRTLTQKVVDFIARAEKKAEKSDEPVFLKRSFSVNLFVGFPEGLGLDLSGTPKVFGRYLTGSIMGSSTGGWWGVTGKLTIRVLAKRHVSPVVSASFGTLQLTSLADKYVRKFADVKSEGDTEFEPGLTGQGILYSKGQLGVDVVGYRLHFLLAAGIAKQIGQSYGGREYNRLDVSGLIGPAVDLSVGGHF